MYIRLATGEKCLKGGLWKLIGTHEYRTLSEGDEMPTYRGRMVLWEMNVK